MSCCNFLVSLILSHREMLAEYKLMTCLPKAFPVFSPFSFSSRCLYPAYVLFMASSLALSSLPCVHLCPNLPSSMILFSSSLFLWCSMPSFGVYQQCLQKTHYRLICLQLPRTFLWCNCIFISFVILILLLFFICRCSSFTFAFRHHPSPFRGLSPSFYTHFILSSQSIAVVL